MSIIAASPEQAAKASRAVGMIIMWRELVWKTPECRDKPEGDFLPKDSSFTNELPKRLREMTRPYNKKLWPDILACIKEGKGVPKNQLPKRVVDAGDKQLDEQVLAQFLSLALANRCAELNVAKQLVGSNDDLRQLVRWHLQTDKTNSTPLLASGWRAEVCGKLIEDVLDGRVVIRVAEPASDHPLAFEYRDEE